MEDNKLLIERFVDDWKMYNRFLVIVYYGYLLIAAVVGIPLTVISAICFSAFFMLTVKEAVVFLIAWAVFDAVALVMQKLWLSRKPRI